MLGEVTVKVETRGLLETKVKLLLAPSAVRAAAKDATEEATEYAAGLIRDLTPVGQGEGRDGVRSHEGQPHLQDMWMTRTRGIGPEYVGEIFNRLPYAGAVERGATPRVIAARRVNWLWWPGIINARLHSVNWPGFAGRWMGSRGLNAATPGIFARYREAIGRALRTVFSG